MIEKFLQFLESITHYFYPPMQNPIDILGIHPGGAFPSKPDPRNYQFGSSEIAIAPAPFDWNIGYSVEKDISSVLGKPFRLTRKNQGQSGSCGGQGMSVYGQALAAYYKGDMSEKSAKFPYAQVYVPGGGSGFDTLASIYKKQGFGLESLTPSYQGGQAPSEAFMERIGDITAAARIAASKEQEMIAYAYLSPTIDAVAQAMAACKGISILLRGSNNGTWLSTDPVPPTPQEMANGPWSPANPRGTWAHYMFGIGALMRNGKKTIAVLQSCGPEVPNDSVQYVSEDYFNIPGAVFEAGVLIFNPKPVVLAKHTFNTDLTQGQSGPEITALQTVLAYDGCFNLAPTGFYGTISAQAVLKFQLKYQVTDTATLNELGGHVVGPATRAKLNSMFG